MNTLVFDEDTRLLRETPGGAATLCDAPEANLFPEIYAFDQVPKVAFGGGGIPMRMPREIYITDTTFRDGQQARAPFTHEQIVGLFDLLHELGGERGVVRQSEFFVYTERDRKALELCRARGYAFPEITTWIRAAKEDFEIVRQLGIGETGILVSCSDYHIFHKMKLTRAGAMEKYLSVVEMALERGIRPRCHFEDITRADIYGFVIPFASALRRLGDEADVPVKIRCCDTLGLGVPYPEAALPRGVPGLLHALRRDAGISSDMLEWHGHNDFHKGVANASAAWLYGAASVNCSLLGIGERAGNVPLEAMAMEYCALRGQDGGMRLNAITRIAEYFREKIGYDIPPQTPFVGDSFLTTRAGIHADGLLKDERIYTAFDTRALLGRENEVLVDAHSGLAGIAYWINRRFNLKLDKKSPVVARVKEAVDALYLTGRTTVMSGGELERLTRAALAAEEGGRSAGRAASPCGRRSEGS